MKLSRLNNRGMAHHFVLALAIVGIVSAFAFQAVAGNAQNGASASSCASGSSLRVGSSGACVKLLQTKLGVTADGNFGPRTKAAVVAFQNKKGLTADGIVGPKTWAALGGTSSKSTSSSKSTPARKTAPAPAVTSYSKATIHKDFCSGGDIDCRTHTTYSACANVVKLNPSGPTASVKFGNFKFVNGLWKDNNKEGSTIRSHKSSICHYFSASVGATVKNTITAGPNTGITSAQLVNDGRGDSASYKLKNKN